MCIYIVAIKTYKENYILVILSYIQIPKAWWSKKRSLSLRRAKYNSNLVKLTQLQ